MQQKQPAEPDEDMLTESRLLAPTTPAHQTTSPGADASAAGVPASGPFRLNEPGDSCWQFELGMPNRRVDRCIFQKQHADAADHHVWPPIELDQDTTADSDARGLGTEEARCRMAAAYGLERERYAALDYLPLFLNRPWLVERGPSLVHANAR